MNLVPLTYGQRRKLVREKDGYGYEHFKQVARNNAYFRRKAKGLRARHE